MIIDCISDLHGYRPELLGGDVLIIAGDISECQNALDVFTFCKWANNLHYDHTILMAGNHDFHIERNNAECRDMFKDFHIDYLEDSGIEIEGVKFWGSPYTPKCGNWAFMKNRGSSIIRHWNEIPDDTDILITHGPAFGYLDKTIQGDRVGCKDLERAIRTIKPDVHVFGHIHESYGVQFTGWRSDKEGMIPFGRPISINCSHVDEELNPTNYPVRFSYDKGKNQIELLNGLVVLPIVNGLE